MKLALFDDFRFGVIRGTEILDVSSVVPGGTRLRPQDIMREVIAGWGKIKPRILRHIASGTDVAPLDSVRLRPPLPGPQNIDCLAANYMENGALSSAPPINAFHKSPSSVIGHGDTMLLPDIPATIFEGEAELAVVIGKASFEVRASDAIDHVFGYTGMIDGSARGLPAAYGFYQMKSRETFCPMGPVITTADEVGDPQNLQIRLWINGELKQDFNTSDMAHDVAHCIEFISATHTIDVGDVLSTGTNHGGLSALMDGDLVELEVEKIGRLRVNIRDDLKRVWSRETRLERQLMQLDGATAPQLSGKYASPEPP